jgi:hypothetical protein
VNRPAVNRPALRWPVVATAAAALVLGVFAMNPLPIGAFHDDARYLLLARSIAQGTGYRFTFVPGQPAGTHFPPAFPLLLAALWRAAPAFPASVTLFKLLNALMLPVAALAVFAFARARAGLAPWAAAGVALAFAGSVPILFLDGVLFSEPFFIAALFGALLVAEAAVAPAAGPRRAGETPLLRIALAAGLAIGAVTMIRTVGIALGVGLVAILVLRRRWRAVWAAVAGIAVFVVPWQLWTMRHGGDIPPVLFGDYGTYGSWVGAALRTDGPGFMLRVAEANLRGFGILLRLFGVAGAPWPVRALVALPLVVALAVGTARLARRAPVSVASAAAYLLVVLAWPGTPDRFLWPVWPLFLTAAACGAAAVVDWQPAPSPRRAARLSELAALAACAVLFAAWNAGEYRTRSWEGPAQSNAKLAEAASETAAQLPDGLVATDFDATVSLYTGRPAVPLLPLMAANYLRARTPREAAGQLADILTAYHPRFLLVASSEALDAARLLAHAATPPIRFRGVTPSGILLYVSTSP